MSEKIIGIVKNVQGKGASSILVKTCDLIITDNRIICVVLGGSTLVSGMIGQAIGGVSGSIAYGESTQIKVDSKRVKNLNKELDKIAAEGDNYQILWSDVLRVKYKTGFFSTLGLFAPLTIYTSSKKYFFNTLNSTKNETKKILVKLGKI